MIIKSRFALLSDGTVSSVCFIISRRKVPVPVAKSRTVTLLRPAKPDGILNTFLRISFIARYRS